jgi:hypothetical protein
MAPRLLACPACARHVRVDEPCCPFCRVDLPGDFGAGPAPVPPPAWATRFDRFFNRRSAAGVVGALAGAAALAAADCNFVTAYGDLVLDPIEGTPDACSGQTYFVVPAAACNAASLHCGSSAPAR